MQMNGWFNRIPQVSRALQLRVRSRPAITGGFTNALQRRATVQPARTRSVFQRTFQARRAALNGVDATQCMGGLLSDIFSPSVAAFKSKIASITGTDVAKAAASAYSARQAAETAKAQVAAAQATQAAEEAKMVTAFSMPKGGISTPVMIAGAAGVGGLLWLLLRRKKRA